MTELQFTVATEEDGRQVKQILRARGVSVRIMNRAKRTEKGICVNGELVVRTIDPVEMGNIITLKLADDTEILEPMEYNLDIIYEDESLLVINKPPTLAMHPTHNHQGDSLANAVTWYLMKQDKTAKFRPVGRLDKGTSGIVVCVLHAFAASKLNGTVKKRYFAVVNGCYEGEGTFLNAIYRPKANCTLRACRTAGEPLQPGDERAVTHWRALGHDSEYSAMEIWLETGRTHQIRAHFAHHGTPLAGDDYYGAPKRETPGHCLHCAEATLIHPVTEQLMRFSAPMPQHMKSLMEPIVNLL
ncbi:MAG: RluA family pseudouridine synthase [Oscillospiraceae bacterium]|jgi:23S rRNA pseudouridine1911/1915/1917 synthase|nr:RluA family pseudouridine synthase [Oscillospiraceae bacterium]